MHTNSVVPGARGGWLLLLSLAACGGPSPLQAPDQDPVFDAAHTNTTVTAADVEFTQFVDCAGENVLWTGIARLVIHTTTNRGVPAELPPGAFQHEIDVESLHLTGIGETSGARYRLNSKLHLIGHSENPVDPFPTVFRVTLRELVTRQPGGAVGEASFQLDLVVSATGDVVIDEVHDFTIECR
jgi:predicted small lipoprotein YifL